MKKFLKLTLFLSLALALTVALICFPQIYSFKYKLEYKEFKLYSDQAFPQNTYAVLDKVDGLIHKSELFKPNKVFKIFVRSNYDVSDILPYQFPKASYASTIPLIDNIFISKGDFQTNTAYKVTGGSRPLDQTIAHEIVHVLIQNDPSIKRALYPEADWSPAGFLWKEEGYADYTGGGTGLDKQKGLDILNGVYTGQYNKIELEYFKYWLAMTYLIEHRKMKIHEILDKRLSLESILDEAQGYWAQQPKKS